MTDPKPIFNMQGRYMTRCQADCDDECEWEGCPQIRDGEPLKTGRHCPLDSEDRDFEHFEGMLEDRERG